MAPLRESILSGDALARGLGIPEEKSSLHQQVERRHVRSRHAFRSLLPVRRTDRERDEAAREADASEGPRACADVGQGREHHQVQGRRDEGRQDHRFASASSSSQPAAVAVVAAVKPGRKIGTLPPRRSELEGIRIQLLHELHGDRPFPKQLPAGIQVGMGKHDRRDG